MKMGTDSCQKLTDSGKHGMTEPSAERSAELFSKTSEMVPNGLFFPLRDFLENTEFLTEFRGIFSKVLKLILNDSKCSKHTQLNYMYNGPQTHRGVCLDHLKPFRISFKTF